MSVITLTFDLDMNDLEDLSDEPRLVEVITTINCNKSPVTIEGTVCLDDEGWSLSPDFPIAALKELLRGKEVLQ
jgi:hypothetical protein